MSELRERIHDRALGRRIKHHGKVHPGKYVPTMLRYPIRIEALRGMFRARRGPFRR